MPVVRWVWHFMIWGAGYQITSGPIIVGALLHRFNCHEPRCPRPVRHGHQFCRKHRFREA